MAEAAGGGHVLEELAAGISEHAIWRHGAEFRVAGAEIKIEPPVIIQIAKVATHGVDDLIKVAPLCDVRERAILVVVVKAQALTRAWQIQIIRCDVPNVLNGITGDEDVLPAII